MLVFTVSTAEEMKAELIAWITRLRRLEKIRPGDSARNQSITEARSNLLHSLILDLSEARIEPKGETNAEGSTESQ